MNCDTLHRRLLGLERPELPPPELRSHLAVCAACREWHRHLIEVERQAGGLPVPPPVRKAAFLARLATSTPSSTERSARHKLNGRAHAARLDRERARTKMALAFAMAAGLLVVALGAWVWNRSPDPKRTVPPETALEKRLKVEPRWGQAKTTERLEILSDLADELGKSTGALAQAEGDELDGQVKLFREVVDEIAGVYAPRLAGEERQRVLTPIVERLARAESEAERLAVRYPGRAVALHELASAARDGERRLRGML